MCELLGLSSRQKLSANRILRLFYSHGEEHPHGWGLALFRPDGSPVIEKEPLKSTDSRYLKARLDADILADNLIGHIRLATMGTLDYVNCHPFALKDLGGRNWTVAHNGTIFDFPALNRYVNQQAGATDSERVALYPGVRRTLDELLDRGWTLGIVTNKPAEPNRLIVEYLGLKQFFQNAIVAGGDCAELKPSALPLRECAARMRGHRLSSHDWMVGDAWTDMQCAANAGLKSAFCTFGFGKLKDSRFTIKINRMDELLRYLKAEE